MMEPRAHSRFHLNTRDPDPFSLQERLRERRGWPKRPSLVSACRRRLTLIYSPQAAIWPFNPMNDRIIVMPI